MDLFRASLPAQATCGVRYSRGQKVVSTFPMLRKSTALVVGLWVLLSTVAAPAHSKNSHDPVFQQLDGIVKSLSEISGLEQKRPVAYGRMSKKQLRHFLAKRIKTGIKPDELRADELSLKLFGLVPQDFDLKKSTLELLTEQAAAFYDYQEKKLFLLDTSSFTEEEVTLAHELSHALVDQHFDMEKFMEEGPSNDDENLAHTAVVEGQATWLMVAYQNKKTGVDPAPTAEVLKQVADGSEASTGQYPVLNGSPLYIQRSLLFPYAEGTLFFDAVYRKMGKKAFAAVFTDPPKDSSQIIHPERYFEHELETKPKMPAWRFDGKQRQLAEGTMGEFDHAILLEQYLGKAMAAELSPHLRGGQFKILEMGKERAPLLEYVSEWDSPEQAKKFFTAYQKVLQAKWAKCHVLISSDGHVAGEGDNGFFTTALDGLLVTSLEGVQDREEWTRLSGANGAAPVAAHSPAGKVL
jgi:hypothetical protein